MHKRYLCWERERESECGLGIGDVDMFDPLVISFIKFQAFWLDKLGSLQFRCGTSGMKRQYKEFKAMLNSKQTIDIFPWLVEIKEDPWLSSEWI